MSHGGDVIVDHNLNHWVVGQNFVFFFFFVFFLGGGSNAVVGLVVNGSGNCWPVRL